MDISFKNIVNRGINQHTPVSLEKCIRLCNSSALVLCIGMLPFMILYGYHQLYSVFSTVSLLAVFNLFVPAINHIGKHQLARVLFLVVNFSIGFVNSTILGQDSLVYLYLVAGLPASVVLFTTREYGLLAFCLGWSVLLIVLDLVLCLTPFYRYELTAEVLNTIRWLVVFGAVSCLLLFVQFFRKESELAQRSSAQLMISTQILKNDLDAVIYSDMSGKIQWVNQAAEQLYGYVPQEFYGRDITTLISTDHDIGLVSQSLNAHCSWSGEVLQQRKDGSHFTALFTQFVVTDDKGQAIGVASSCKDISQHKQTEMALIEAKEKAEEAAIVKANFLATMSHEIRTPLHGVIGMAHLLLEDDPKPEHIESLNILKFAAENLLTLINDVLDFSKIDAGRITLETIPFCFSELIRSIESSAKYQAIEKGIEFRVVLDHQLERSYQTDPVRLTQVLLNLISNAIKFTKEGGVTLYINSLASDNDNVEVEFKVIDTGIGIVEEQLEHIFEQFSQADSAITRHYGGSGLGLAITKGLLEAFGSEITVASQPGVGTTFAFTLKMQKVAEVEGYPPSLLSSVKRDSLQGAVAVREFEGLSVLVAEDNPVNIMVIKKLLTKWGVALDVVNNGELAVQRIQEKNYDLVLMDIQMPVMDGFQATLAIRSLLKGAPLPIIALTATATEEFKTEAFTVGMNDYLSKPFNPNHLKLKIKQLCLPLAVGYTA